jgi:hypothetical protein
MTEEGAMLVADSATKDLSSKTIEIYTPTPMSSLTKTITQSLPKKLPKTKWEHHNQLMTNGQARRVYERNGTYLGCHRRAKHSKVGV